MLLKQKLVKLMWLQKGLDWQLEDSHSQQQVKDISNVYSPTHKLHSPDFGKVGAAILPNIQINVVP